MKNFAKYVEHRLIFDHEGWGGLKELSKNLCCLIKIIDDYSHDPVQMEKELNNFYYTKSDELKRMVDYFDYVETSVIPIDIFKGYFPSKKFLYKAPADMDKLEYEMLLKEFQVFNANFRKLANLELEKSPSYKEEDQKIGFERGPFKEVIDGIKKGVMLNAGARDSLIKRKKMQINIPKFPEGLKWEEITIRFLNGGEVQITARDLIYSADFESMGFKNEKNKGPTMQWNLLRTFSIKGGIISWENNQDLEVKTRDRIKKQKQELSDKLKFYFNKVEGDPFSDYKKEGGYKIKINLIPEQGIDLSLLNTEHAIEDCSDKIDADIQADSREDWY